MSTTCLKETTRQLGLLEYVFMYHDYVFEYASKLNLNYLFIYAIKNLYFWRIKGGILEGKWIPKGNKVYQLTYLN